MRTDPTLKLPQLQPLWTPIQKTCLSLLQRSANTFTSILQIHAFMLRNSLESNINLLTKFITAASSILPGLRHARLVFDCRHQSGLQKDQEDTFLCNSMIKGHLGLSQFHQGFILYGDLRRNTNFMPDSYTFTGLVKSCCSNSCFWEGLQMQCHVMKTGLWLDLYVGTGFVDMYAKAGKLESAKMVFDEMPVKNLVSWTALMGGFVRSADMVSAEKLFYAMPERDVAVFNAMIDGFVKLGDVDTARSFFDKMPERNVVSWTSMIYGYFQKGDVESAKFLFDAMPSRNIYSWNVMINGYCQNKQPHNALKLFHDMQRNELIEPDKVTVVSLLPAIADIGSLDLGNWIYQFVCEKKFDKAVNICTALVDMFAKCGDVGKAMAVFNGMQEHQVESWNALINGLAVNGCGKEAMEVFLWMMAEGFKPNAVTMLAVLSACNHAGLLTEAKTWFEAMEDFGITPQIEHYGCMVDLFGRAGQLEEAEKLMMNMPYKPNGIIISSFLFACGHFKNMKKAEGVARDVLNMDPQNDGNYIILRNLYATESRWRDVEKVKQLMTNNGANKEVGCSIIELDGRMIEFVAGNRVHPQLQMIQSTLDQLFRHMDRQIIWLAPSALMTKACALVKVLLPWHLQGTSLRSLKHKSKCF